MASVVIVILFLVCQLDNCNSDMCFYDKNAAPSEYKQWCFLCENGFIPKEDYTACIREYLC